MEKITIKNIHNEILAGILHPVDNKDLAIVCPGRLCTKDLHFLPELCDSLQAGGLNAFRFDFAGNGESEGAFAESTVTKAIEDIRSVVEHFKGHDYRIRCIIGHSLGAAVVLLYQAKYGSSDRVVAIAGLADQTEITTKKYTPAQKEALDRDGYLEVDAGDRIIRMSKEYLYDRAGYGDIRGEVKKITVPVLVVHGTDDPVIDVKNGEFLAAAAGVQGTFLPVKGAGHFFDGYYGEFIDLVVKFISI